MLKKLGVIFSCLLLLSLITQPFISVASAQTLNDLDKQIQDKKNEKTANENALANAQALLKSLQNQKYSVSGDINGVKSQITDIENKVNDVKNQIAILEKNIKDTENEIAFQKQLRENQIREYFIESYSNTTLETILSSEAGNFSDFTTMSAINSYTLTNKKKDLDEMSVKYQELTVQKQQVDQIKTQLDQKSKELANQKSKLETQLTYLANNINNTSSSANNIQKSLKDINSNLSYLDARRTQLLEAELAKMAANQQVQQTELKSGQYFFLGRGRDLIEGHGMGMSQWGMYGMALNYGWKYDQILTFYYTGTTIGNYDEPAQIVVDGKTSGPISFDDYLAGIGEVPNDWPAESIKAQVVAARTYAMRSAYTGSDGLKHICGTDACQVYLGGTAKKDYVLATKGKVILYNNAPIVAYYSASHRGCSSTLPTVWGSTDLPYIQSVKDDAYAYKDYKSNNPYNTSQLITTYNWQWRTNGYSLDDLSNILSKSSSTNVGKLQSITTTKDQCGRVSKITLTGSGGTKTLTGWDFRAIFNDITPYDDYVYSTEFGFYQK